MTSLWKPSIAEWFRNTINWTHPKKTEMWDKWKYRMIPILLIVLLLMKYHKLPERFDSSRQPWATSTVLRRQIKSFTQRAKSRSVERGIHVVSWKLCRRVYLQVLLWVWFFTVFTFYDPPFARICNVLFQVFSFHGRLAIFVGASNNSKQASLQVSLF